MTVEEIFKELADHMLQGLKVHDDFANYYDFLGLKGYRKCHQYHFLEETCSYRKLCKYYISHFNKMIEKGDLREENRVIPTKWYQHTRQDIETSLRRDAVKVGLQAWANWEQETKDLYQRMYVELISLNEVNAAMFVKCMVEDVSEELKKVQSYHLNKKAIDYDMSYIIGQQKELHHKFKQKMKYIKD